jgi:hypothetical protein
LESYFSEQGGQDIKWRNAAPNFFNNTDAFTCWLFALGGSKKSPVPLFGKSMHLFIASKFPGGTNLPSAPYL